MEYPQLNISNLRSKVKIEFGKRCPQRHSVFDSLEASDRSRFGDRSYKVSKNREHSSLLQKNRTLIFLDTNLFVIYFIS